MCMSQVSQFEADPFLKLLTDALRAGPGSPQWHEAVRQLREVNPSEADEYRLIITAREHLESGRDYRSIRAGQGFTRKVMDAIEQESGRRGRLPLANVIAGIAALCVVSVIVVLCVVLYRGGAPAGTVDELAGMYFGKPAIASEFIDSTPPEWQQFGLAPVKPLAGRGLRGGHFAENEREYRGGGVHAASPLPVEQAFALEATIRTGKATSQVDLQVFVAESPNFAGAKATGDREFVVELLDGQVSIFKPVTSLAAGPARVDSAGGTLRLLIKIDRTFTVVECDGRQIYAGPHGLGTGAQRWPGVRFLTRGPEKGLEDVSVQSLRVLKP
jgi:hypothetical protein